MLAPQEMKAARAALVSEQRRILERRASELDEESRLLDRPEGDPVDLSTLQREAGLIDVFSDQELRRLKEIDAALQRLEAGTYGDCLRCGKPINPKRLAALPASAYCGVCLQLDGRS